MVRRQLQMENMYELMGTYYVEDNQYSIEPIPASKETISGTLNHTISILTEHLNLKDDIINFGSYEFPPENTLNRYKRQLHINNKYTVELLMVVDHAIYKTWYDGINESDPARRREKTLETIKQYYAFVLNGIDVRYATIQEPDLTIDVVFAGILIFDDEQDSYLSTSNLLPGQLVESSDALETFRQWVLSNMTSLPPSDHVMLFTGFNLTYGGSTSNAGLAYLKSICNHEYFFSIVEEYFEFRVISIAAHELGHSLGARHDMDENTCLSFQLYIMTSRFKFPSKSKAANPYRFSKCSIQYFKDFIFSLKDLGLHCLKTQDSMKDVKEISGYLVQQPGETYTADTQCQNSHGDNSYVCRDRHQGDYRNICSQGLLCYNPELIKCSKILPGDGTPCALNQWCMNGTCIEDTSVHRLADDCPFGDLPGTVRSNETCHDVITQSPWECYEERMRLNCCDSCFYKHSSVQGCEYGDRVFDCVKEQCNDYNETTRSVDCCETCSDVPFPTRPTRTTTTPSPTTTFTLTTTVVPITTFTDTSKVIPTTTSASTLKETSTNSLAEPITPADNYIKPTTPNNVKPVVTMVTSRSYHQTTSPSPQSVTSNVDQVTTLYDVGGVTFKSSDQIAPTDLTLRDSNPDSRRLTSTSSRSNPTNNYYRNRNWDPNSVTSAPLTGPLTTSGYVTQNEKPTLGHTPPRGTTKFKPRYDQDSTSERSHENVNGGQPGIATIANNYLNLKNQNIDMTSSSQLRPRDGAQRWLNDFLATRLTSRNIGDRNSGNERHEGESYEDVNTSGGLSEEDIHGNSGSAWRRRVLNHRHHNTPDSERKDRKSKSFYVHRLLASLDKSSHQMKKL